MFREIRGSAEANQLEYNAMAYMTTKLTRYIAIHDSLQLIELGVEDLMHGQLTPRLIDAELIEGVLADITKALSK